LRYSNMKKIDFLVAIFFAITFLPQRPALHADEAPAKLVPVLKIDKEYDKRTAIKPSTVPNGGNGLFALAAIKKGEVVGELGGRLVTAEDYPLGNSYLASIPECAWAETHPFKYLDSKDFGGNVSRTNFAPSKINGIETNFQNAAIRQFCEYPYFVFVAIKDIEPGTEIWASYGPHYDYEKFMYAPEVRDFFCGLIKLDCREKYSYEP
jgi:SET domain-containing protein